MFGNCFYTTLDIDEYLRPLYSLEITSNQLFALNVCPQCPYKYVISYPHI